jgi:hypothetical protein
MIATSFADFRPYIPFFVPYSELSDYYSIFGNVINQEELENRLMMELFLKIILVWRVFY